MKAMQNSKKDSGHHASTVIASLEASPRFEQLLPTPQSAALRNENMYGQQQLTRIDLTNSRQIQQKSSSKHRNTHVVKVQGANSKKECSQPIKAVHLEGKQQQLTKKEHAIAAVNPIARKRLLENFTKQQDQNAQKIQQTRKLTIKANQVKFLGGPQAYALKSVQHQVTSADENSNSQMELKKFKFAEQGMATPTHGKRLDDMEQIELAGRGSTQLASFSGSISSTQDNRKQTASVRVQQKTSSVINKSHGPSHSQGSIMRKQRNNIDRNSCSLTDLQKSIAMPAKSPTVSSSVRASRRVQESSQISQIINGKRQSFAQKNSGHDQRASAIVSNSTKARRASYHQRDAGAQPRTAAMHQRPMSAVKRVTESKNRDLNKFVSRKNSQRSVKSISHSSMLAPSSSEVKGGRVYSKKAEQPAKDAGAEVISVHEQSMEQLTGLRVEKGVIKGRLDLHADLSKAAAKISEDKAGRQSLEIDCWLGLSVTINDGDVRPDIKIAHNPRPKMGSPDRNIESRFKVDVGNEPSPQICMTNNELDLTQKADVSIDIAPNQSQPQEAKRPDADEDMNIATIDLDPPPSNNAAFGAGDSPNVLKKSSHKNMMIKQNNFNSLSRRDGNDRYREAVPVRADPNLRFRQDFIQNIEPMSEPHVPRQGSSINRAHEMSVGRAPSAVAEVRGSQSMSRAGNRSRLPSRKRYQMDQRSTQTKLVIAKKDIKYVTVNMLNRHLVEIDLSGNKISSLPDELCTLANLETLDLSSNHLSQLPAQFGQLSNLKSLNLSQNCLTSLRDNLTQCRDLRVLNLTENKLETLPVRLGDLHQLHSLLLLGNRLAEIPASMASLRDLSTISFEWFNYLKPYQETMQQKGSQHSQTIISKLREFCGAKIVIKNEPSLSTGPQLSFCEFLLYVYVVDQQRNTNLHAWEVIDGINSIRFGVKDRCISQHLCSKGHAHLLQDVVRTRCSSGISRMINENLELNTLDSAEQAPLLGALRQQSSEFARIMLSSPSTMYVDLNRQSLKHGYPLHMAILSHKFEVALQLLSMEEKLDPHVLNTVGANVVHLLFVKYEKDPKTAFEILRRCQKLGVALNLIDRMQAAPLHLALGKKQYQAIRDMSQINRELTRPAFDFNITDKRGCTPLHYAVEKQDHELFLALIHDPFIDVNQVDSEEYNKARRISVIFSAFHKILYAKEKLPMRRQFYFEESRLAEKARKAQQEMLYNSPAHPQQPLFSATNRTKKHIDFGISDDEPSSKRIKDRVREASVTAKRKQQRSFIAPERHPILGDSMFEQKASVASCRSINQLKKIFYNQDTYSDLSSSFVSDMFNADRNDYNNQMVEHTVFNFRSFHQAQKLDCDSNIDDDEWQSSRLDNFDQNRAIQLFQKELVKKAVAAENPYLHRAGRSKPATFLHNSKQGISLGNVKETRSLSIMSRMSVKSDMPATKLIQSKPHLNPGVTSQKSRVHLDASQQQYFTSSEIQKPALSMYSYQKQLSQSNQKSSMISAAAVKPDSRANYANKPLLSPQDSQHQLIPKRDNMLGRNAKPPVDQSKFSGRKQKPNSFDCELVMGIQNDLDKSSSALDDARQELSSNLHNLDQLSQLNPLAGENDISQRDVAISEYQMNRLGKADKPLDLRNDKRSVLSATTPLNIQQLKLQDVRSAGMSGRSPLQLSQYVPKPRAGRLPSQPALDRELSNSHSVDSGWLLNDDRQQSIEKNYFQINFPSQNVIPAAAVQGHAERAQSTRIVAPAAIPAAAVPVPSNRVPQAQSRGLPTRRGAQL